MRWDRTGPFCSLLHILSEVQYTCSRLLIINRGKIAADGPVSDLVSRAGGEVRISVEASGQGIADGLAALPEFWNALRKRKRKDG